MVTYQEWTSIGHEVYKGKGGEYPEESTATSVTRELARYWTNNTRQLQTASKSEAREIARAEMNV